MAQYHLRENMGVNNQYIKKVRNMDPDERQELIDDFRTAANVAWNNDFNASIIGKWNSKKIIKIMHYSL